MKRILLAAALLLSASSVFAEWTYANHVDNNELYFDPSTVKYEGSTVKYWLLISYKEAQSPSHKPYRSAATLRQIDCSSDKARPVSSFYYSGEKASGSIVESETVPNKWVDIVPGSISAHYRELLCKKAK